MQELALASGWNWPNGGGVAAVERLAQLSDDWDFRGRARKATTAGGGSLQEPPQSIERADMPVVPTEIGGRFVPEPLIHASAAALGLVRSQPPPAHRFSHIVILSGAAVACLNRARYAADLLGAGVEAAHVVSLGAHRLLGTRPPPGRPDGMSEREQAQARGFGAVDSEWAVVLAAARQAFSLGEPEWFEESGPDLGSEEQRLARSARYGWPDVEVVITPSERPEQRQRANTTAQLRHWLELAGLGPADHVLLVTTQIYVPYQHLVGVEVLGLGTGCGVWTCGVDAEHSTLPTRAFTGTDYLQEIRSTLLAARSLLARARSGVS
jgi:hypothetical protein